MKKWTALYKSYMLRPMIYKTVTRASVTAAACLVWDRFFSDGHFSIWQAPGLLCGVVLLGWAWINYLGLDGFKVQFLGRQDWEAARAKKKKQHATHSIVDYADEKLVSFDELTQEEQKFCSMLSSLLLGVPLVVIGAIASVM